MKNKNKIIELFDNKKYSCDELGNIYSHRFGYPKKIKGHLNDKKHGRIQYTIYYNKDEKIRIYGHQMVFLYFNRNAIFKNREINHIDGNPLNNKLDNLELISQFENRIHFLMLKGHIRNEKLRGENHHSCSITKEIAETIIYLSGEGIKPSYIARLLLVKRSTVKNVIYKNAWKWIKDVTNKVDLNTL